MSLLPGKNGKNQMKKDRSLKICTFIFLFHGVFPLRRFDQPELALVSGKDDIVKSFAVLLLPGKINHFQWDPVWTRDCFQLLAKGQFSFEVVLVELLTGQKPIRSTDSKGDRSLASYFVHALKENQLFEVLDRCLSS